jgi:cold shock protein
MPNAVTPIAGRILRKPGPSRARRGWSPPSRRRFALRSCRHRRRGSSSGPRRVRRPEITPDERNRDLFVHQTRISSDRYRTLPEGSGVSYEEEQGDKGAKAVNVTRL